MMKLSLRPVVGLGKEWPPSPSLCVSFRFSLLPPFPPFGWLVQLRYFTPFYFLPSSHHSDPMARLVRAQIMRAEGACDYASLLLFDVHCVCYVVFLFSLFVACCSPCKRHLCQPEAEETVQEETPLREHFITEERNELTCSNYANCYTPTE